MTSESGVHLCAADGCTAKIKSELLMCLTHWYMLPRPLQIRIYRTWRTGDFPSWGEHVREAKQIVRDEERRRAADHSGRMTENPRPIDDALSSDQLRLW